MEQLNQIKIKMFNDVRILLEQTFYKVSNLFMIYSWWNRWTSTLNKFIALLTFSKPVTNNLYLTIVHLNED